MTLKIKELSETQINKKIKLLSRLHKTLLILSVLVIGTAFLNDKYIMIVLFLSSLPFIIMTLATRQELLYYKLLSKINKPGVK